jgi:hypothetical protein
MAEHIDRHAVIPFCSRLMRKWKPRQFCDYRFQRPIRINHQFRLAIHFANRRVFEEGVRQACGMREQVTNEDRTNEIHLCRACQYADFAELRKKLRERIQQLESTLFI